MISINKNKDSYTFESIIEASDAFYYSVCASVQSASWVSFRQFEIFIRKAQVIIIIIYIVDYVYDNFV